MSVLLETPRLRLRDWRIPDLDPAFAIFSDPEVMRYVGNGLPVTDRAAFAQRLAGRAGVPQSLAGGSWVVEELASGAFIGSAGLSPIEATGETEIFYNLGQPWWGRGYATELARPLLALGFERGGLDRILGLTYPQNLPSERVLLKTGLEPMGRGRYFGLEMSTFAAERPGRDRGREERFTLELPSPPARVFAAWTGWGASPGWLPRGGELEPWVAGRYRSPAGHAGRCLCLIPGARLAFTWERTGPAAGSTFEIELVPEGERATRLSLVHRDLGTEAAAAEARAAWPPALKALAAGSGRARGERAR